MIESILRKTYQKVCVDPVLKPKSAAKLHPLWITLAGTLTGMTVPFLLVASSPLTAIAFLLLSGYLDTLDGSLARKVEKTSTFGAALDIVSDRVVESAVIIGLFLVAPQTRGLPCLLMLGSTLLCVTTFLVVGIFTQNTSEKSFHYSPGLMERAEAFALFIAMMALPSAFLFLSGLYTLLVMATAFIRLYQFGKTP